MRLRVALSRRWAGGVALATAIGMIVAGEMVLNRMLGPATLAIYYAVCFLLTTFAILVAFVDARQTALRSAKEQRDLFDTTLRKIEEEAKHRRADRFKGNGGNAGTAPR